MRKIVLGTLCALGIGTAHAAIGTGPGGQFIQVTNTLQAGATFFVSSGTVRNLRVSTITFSDGSVQTTAAVSGGSASTLQIKVNGVQISSPTSSLQFDSNFTGNQPSAGVASISLNPGSTLYIQNTNTIQSGATYYVSSGTVSGQLTIRNGAQKVVLMPSTTTLVQLINVSSESAYIQIVGSNTNRWRIGSDVKALNNRTFDIYNETTTVSDISISTADIITVNGTIYMANLTASRPVKLDSNKQIVTGLIDVTSDITGTVPSTNLPSNVAYTNVSNNFSSSQTFTTIQFATATVTKAIIWPDGTIQVSSPTSGGGSGSPGGSNTQFQYNNSGSFAGSADLVTNGSTVTATNLQTSTMTVTQYALFQNMSTTTFKSVTSMTLNDGVLLDLSSINDSNTSEGLKLPQNTNCANATAQGQTCWKTDSKQLYIGDGSSINLIGPSSFTPNSTDYIQNTTSLQTGATFYVSSGSISGQLDVSSITAFNQILLSGVMNVTTRTSPQIRLNTNSTIGLRLDSTSANLEKGASVGIHAGGSLNTLDNQTLMADTAVISQDRQSVTRTQSQTNISASVPYVLHSFEYVDQNTSANKWAFIGTRNNPYEDSFFTIAGSSSGSLGLIIIPSSDAFHIDVTTSSTKYSYVGINISTPLAQLSVGGHIETSSNTATTITSSPTVSSCGTNPSVSGTDVSGKITIGGGIITSCLLTFGKSWTNAPACTILSDTAITAPTGTTTKTIFTMGAGATFAGDVIMYNCFGYQ